MTTIKGAIFDVDGTLLDSMAIWQKIEANYLIRQGATPRPGLEEDLRSLSLIEAAKYFQVEYGIKKSIEEIDTEKSGMMEDFYYNEAPLKAGVASVLEALHSRGVKMCVATATDRFLIEPALRRCGILKYFGRIFTCSEEETSKSRPDIFIRAAGFLGTNISETLVVEDALYAIKSAKKAGFPVAAVYDESADDQQDIIKRLADYYYISIDEMLETLMSE